MPENDPQLYRIAHGLKTLSVAVWCLVAIGVVQLSAWLLPFLAPELLIRSPLSSSEGSRQELESWKGLSIEEMLRRSSVVVITENRREGDKLRAIIKEIPKRAGDTTFYFNVGDEYPPLTVVPAKDSLYGDGALVLLQGSPATMKHSYAIYDGSLPGLGDLSLIKVRQLIQHDK